MGYNKQWENYTEKYQKLCMENDVIPDSLFKEYGVNRGLRDINGNGVLTGLTNISRIDSFCVKDGKKVPCDGKLWYRGYNVTDWIRNIPKDSLGFGKTAYLLLFGKAPTAEEEKEFKELMGKCRALPTNFTRDVIMKAPSANLMNGLQKSVLTLYSYDANPDDISVSNVLRQSLQLIAKLPLIAVYNYHAYRHFHFFDSLVIKPAKPELSTAENILQMLRPNGKYTPLEARVLDAALVLHAEHGGGNNSTFTNHVVTSSGTDTYSAVAASIASLKGPRHGGANLKVQQMFADLHEHVTDLEDDDQIQEYLQAVLRGDAFDHSGLIYGMGHAVYTLSDPREVILKDYAQKLAESKGMLKEYSLYDRVERIGTQLLSHRNHVVKPICANVDFYSGFIYTMLGIPEELFTPIFAISRIAGWSAHRLEELVNRGKIIRPAYKYVGHHRPFVDAKDRGTTEK